jgi:predicted dehydrogenase
MSQVKPVKVAVIGCGTISRIYMENIRRFRILDLVACADIIPERAEKRAGEFGIKIMNNEEILKNHEIEIVMNLTCPEAHYQVSKSILEAGKHCCVEKMMAANFSEALELSAFAKRKSLLYCAAPDTFLGGGWQTVRKYLDNGIIGKPIGVNAAISCSCQPVTGSFDLGGYYLHNMINLFGSVGRVSGFGADTPTTLSGTMEFEGGVFGAMLMSSDASVYDTFSVQGTEASMTLFHPNFFSGPLILHRTRPTPDSVAMPVLHGYCENSRALGLADMAYALRNKRRPRTHGDLGLHAMEVIHGMLESAKTNRVYKMTTRCVRPKMRRTGTEIGNAQELSLDD